MRQKVLLIIVVCLLLVSGAIAGYRSYAVGQFLSAADSAFEKGNYLAALANYFVVNEEKDDILVASKIVKTKELLVAEENFKRAKAAAEEGDWLEAKFLLSDIESAPDSNLSEQMFLLYEQAAEKVRDLEEKIAVEMQVLRDEAAGIKSAKEAAEQETAQVEERLKDVEKAKALAEEEISIAQQETQAALKSAEEERIAKFKNEFALLINLLESGSSLV